MSRPAWVRYRPRTSRTAQQVRAGMTHTDYFCNEGHLMDKEDPYCYRCAFDMVGDYVWHLEFQLRRIIARTDDPEIVRIAERATTAYGEED